MHCFFVDASTQLKRYNSHRIQIDISFYCFFFLHPNIRCLKTKAQNQSSTKSCTALTILQRNDAYMNFFRRILIMYPKHTWFSYRFLFRFTEVAFVWCVFVPRICSSFQYTLFSYFNKLQSLIMNLEQTHWRRFVRCAWAMCLIYGMFFFLFLFFFLLSLSCCFCYTRCHTFDGTRQRFPVAERALGTRWRRKR